jgi:hypothetical protein
MLTLNTRLGGTLMKNSKTQSLESLYHKREKALELVAAIWQEGGESEADFDGLNRALDALTLAHVTVTFDIVNRRNMP